MVTPIIKNVSLLVADLKNCGPESGVSFIAKLVERVVAKQLCDGLHAHGLENSYQSAYKASHSTETALLTVDKVHLSFARGDLMLWYYWTSPLPLTQLITPLCSIVYSFGLAYVAQS